MRFKVNYYEQLKHIASTGANFVTNWHLNCYIFKSKLAGVIVIISYIWGSMMRFCRLPFVFACVFYSSLAFGQVPVAVEDNPPPTPEDTPTTFNVTDNDTEILFAIDPATVDLDQGTAGIQNTFSNADGDWVVDTEGNVTYTPALNFNGNTSIPYTVQNNLVVPVTSLPANINVSVTAVNDDPTITPIEDQSIAFNSSTGPIDFTVDDIETPGTLTVSGSSNNTTLVPDANIVVTGTGASRTVTVTPAADQSGNATITLTVDDGTSTAFIEFGLTVAANEPPTISAITDQSTAEGTPTGAIAFTVGDAETAPGSLTVSGSSSNTTLVPNTNIAFGGSGAGRTITITPAAGESGTSTITVTVSDGTDDASTDFLLTVTAANTPPTISAISDQSTAESTATGAIAFTVGDAETAPGSLTVSGSSSDVTLIPNTNIAFGGSGANRTVTITPAAGQTGTSTITITVSDGTDDASTDFTLTVDAVNDPPTISAISNQSTPEDTPTGAIAFTVGDPDNAAATLTVTGSSSNTTLVPNPNIVFGGSGANRTVTLTPATGQTGTSTITLTVSDGTATASINFILTVSDVNDAPTISGISDQTTTENTATAAIPFTINDAETAAASLTLTASSSNTSLVPVANITFGGTGTNRTVTIEPGASQSGTATITITVSDGTASASTAFALTINPINDAPTITPISDQTTAENTPTSAIPFNIGDAETPAANLTISASSSVTTLVSNGNIDLGGSGSDRTITLTPTAGQSGTTEITITVSDGAAATSTSFTLTVSSVNDAPTITAISNQTTNEDTATPALPFTLGDADTPASELTVTASSSNTTLVPDANIALFGDDISRTVTVTPAADQTGTATITLTVSDGTGSASTSFQLTVTAINDPPTITAISDQTTAENTATDALAFSVSDGESAATALVVTATSSNLVLVPNANISLGGSGEARTVAVTPANGQSGETTITLTVSDGTDQASTSFTLTVTSVNDAPTITVISAQTTNEDVATTAISFTVGDQESAAGSLTVTGSSSDKTLVPDANIAISGSGANRSVVITPAANQNGSTTITLTVSDGTASAQTAFQLTVTPVDDAPIITAQDALTTLENTPITLVPGNFTIVDPDNTSNALSLILSPGTNYALNGTTITPKTDFVGELTVVVKAFDGKNSSSEFIATITVTDVNFVPKILGQKPEPIPLPVNESLTLNTSYLEIQEEDEEDRLNLTVKVFPGDNYSLSGSALTTITPSLGYEGALSVTVTVSDGKSESAPFILAIDVFQPGAEPSINGQEVLFTNEDIPLSILFEHLSVSDADDDYPNGFTLQLGTGENFTVNGNEVIPNLNYTGELSVPVSVNDGEFPSNTFPLTILVLPINDKPEITAIESTSLLYEPGSGPIPLTEIFECIDVDSDFLNFAEVGFVEGTNYSPENDELIFENNDTSPIRGVYDPARGVLSLIGYASIEEYTAAIRSIQYNYKLTVDINGEPSQISTEPKDIYFTVSDGPEVSDVRTRSIELEIDVELSIPNAFTPNGDEANSVWAVEPYTNTDQFNDTVVKVYNKRGLLVYEAIGLEKKWDGTFNGEQLPVDTYYYTIDLRLSFIKKTYKGAVMILR